MRRVSTKNGKSEGTTFSAQVTKPVLVAAIIGAGCSNKIIRNARRTTEFMIFFIDNHL